MGLAEVIGFALGAGAMARALVVLEANLSNSDRIRRVVREGGLWAELERTAAAHHLVKGRPGLPGTAPDAPRRADGI